MKLTCLQENLNFGLQSTGHLVNKNINLPILNNVLLEVKEGGLRLSSTNLEIGISSFVRCKVDGAGSFTVDARVLSEYVNLLPNDQINIELDKNDFLKVSCKNYETKIKGIEANDFPVIPVIEKKDAFKIKIAEFKKALSQVIFAVASSENRPELSGVLLSFNKIEKGKLILVGTDSYRLAEKKLAIESTEEREVIVPVKTLQEVIRILSTIKEQTVEDIEIYISDNQILFVIDSIELISRLIEGQFPDYRQIIPQNSKTRVIASTGELVKIIKTVALFSKVGIFDVNIQFEPNVGMIVKANNIQVGESSSELDVEYVGETNEIILNYRYLLEGLNQIESEAEIKLVDGNIPCLITSKGKDDYLYMIMPIRQ